MLLFAKGEFETCISIVEQLLSQEISNTQNTYMLLEILHHILMSRNKRVKAELIKKRAVKLDPKNSEIYYKLGLFFGAIRSFDVALKFYSLSRQVNPRHFGSYNDAALIYEQLDELDKAIYEIRIALDINSSSALAHYNYGNILVKTEQYLDAIYHYKRAIEIGPITPAFFINLGNTFQCLERYVEAFDAYKMAHDLADGTLKSQINNNLGNTSIQLEKFSEAREFFKDVLSTNPDDPNGRFNLASLDLLLGNFETGFQGYEARAYKKDPVKIKSYEFPLYTGRENLDGKSILVHCEQGFGDTIQFARYLGLLNKLAAKTYFLPQGRLIELLKGLVFDVTIIGDDISGLEPDYHIPLLSLPMAFKTTIDTIPSPTPYLMGNQGKVDEWKAKLGSHGIKIGIFWQGRKSEIDVGRSFPVRHFEPISRIEGVRLLSLQKGDGEEQLKSCAPSMIVETLGDDFDSGPQSFTDAAAVILNSDLVITSDSAIAHLAGALGSKVWVLLRCVPEWRWQLEGEISPWYSTMRLFRQKDRGNWETVFLEIEHQIKIDFLISQQPSAKILD